MFKALKYQQKKYQMEGKNTPNFGRHVEHHGYDGWVIVAVDDEAHFAEFSAEVCGVLRQLSEAVSTWKEQINRGIVQDVSIKLSAVTQSKLGWQHIFLVESPPFLQCNRSSKPSITLYCCQLTLCCDWKTSITSIGTFASLSFSDESPLSPVVRPHRCFHLICLISPPFISSVSRCTDWYWSAISSLSPAASWHTAYTFIIPAISPWSLVTTHSTGQPVQRSNQPQ